MKIILGILTLLLGSVLWMVLSPNTHETKEREKIESATSEEEIDTMMTITNGFAIACRCVKN